MENESQVERIIKDNPHNFKDELDKWLFREFNLLGGVWSSITEREKYSLAREVAEKAMEYAKQEMLRNAVKGVVYGKRSKDGYIMARSDYFNPEGRDLDYLDKIQVIIIKEEEK